jgi:hypothetical protein
MINRKLAKTVSLLLLTLMLSSNAYPQGDCYNDPPPGLQRLVQSAAEAIVADPSTGPDFVSARYSQMVAWTIADALSGSVGTNVKELEAYRYLGETARTDKQVGASAKSTGSTSAIERPGLINLLGFAIEHGAIQQEVSDTTLTLSTSPYAFVAAAFGDTPATYQNYEFLNRLGVSATFNLDDKENVLTSVSKKQLSEWSARVRLSGDRSTRSAAFQRFWDAEIGPFIQKRINITEDFSDAVKNDDNLGPIVNTDSTDSPVARLKGQIRSYLSANPTDTDEKKATAVTEIKKMIYCNLKEVVFDPALSGALQMEKETLDILRVSFKDLAVVHAEIAIARKKLVDFLALFMKQGTLSTFAYTNHRTVMGSDYSEAKLLFEHHVKPFDVIANATVSIYHDPDPMKNQEKIRDFNLALSFQGSSKNPFRSESEDLSRITYSFTGRYQRFKENEDMTDRKPDLSSAQFRIDIPITLGLSIPIAYTYSSATETSMKKESKFNIGLHLDIDKLISMRRAAATK